MTWMRPYRELCAPCSGAPFSSCMVPAAGGSGERETGVFRVPTGPEAGV